MAVYSLLSGVGRMPEHHEQVQLRMNPEKIIFDTLVLHVAKHVVIMGIGIHQLKLCGNRPAGTKYDNMIPPMIGKNIVKHAMKQFVARALTVRLSNSTRNKNRGFARLNQIFINDVAVGLLELRKIKRWFGKITAGAGRHAVLLLYLELCIDNIGIFNGFSRRCFREIEGCHNVKQDQNDGPEREQNKAQGNKDQPDKY